MKCSANGLVATAVLLAALAGATVASADPYVPQDDVGPAEASLSRAAEAHAEAASEAARGVVSAAKLDLDIRLVGHTSIQVASDRS